MDVTTTLNEIIKLIAEVVVFFKDQVNAYKQVTKAATDLKTKIENFKKLIAPALKYENHPIFDHLDELQTSIATTKKEIDEFLKIEKDHAETYEAKPRWKQLLDGYKFKRASRAKGLQQLFNAENERIEKATHDLNIILQVSGQMMKTGAYRFRDTMSTEAYNFWQYIMGDDLSSQGPVWGRFISAYKKKYNQFNSNQWDHDISVRMKAIACVDGEDMTISGYALLTDKCGFPMNPAKLPSVLNSPISISAQTRTHVVTSINELILFFSTEEMRQHLATIQSWYADVGKKPKEKEQVAQWAQKCQERANKWATAFKKSRTKRKIFWTPYDYLLNDIEMARRTVFYFYHRFQALMKIGKLSKELLKEFDFPGKPRLNIFLDLVKPLDKANYEITFGNAVHKWEKEPSKVPQVYQFVEEYLGELEASTTPETASSSSSPANRSIVSSHQPTNRFINTFISYLDKLLQFNPTQLYILSRALLAVPTVLIIVFLTATVIDMFNILDLSPPFLKFNINTIVDQYATFSMKQ